MNPSIISSLSNPVVKRARSLRQRKARMDTGLFLVEGLHHVGEAVEAGWDVDTILYAPDLLTSSFGNTLLSGNAATLQPVSGDVMESLADKENPQGILAIVRQRRIELSSLSALRRAVALVTPQDPGNVGTILRTMDAVDADALILVDGGVDPYHPTCVRASMGALFWKPMIQADFARLMAWSKRQGLTIIGTTAHATLDYRSYEPKEPWLLLMGSEQKGLNEAQLALCDTSIGLPMRGRASSLNLAVATSVLLYYLRE